MISKPTYVKTYPAIKDVNIAIQAFCNGCPVGAEYHNRELQLKDMKHPNGAILLGENGENIFSDAVLVELRNVCEACLRINYPELLAAIQNISS